MPPDKFIITITKKILYKEAMELITIRVPDEMKKKLAKIAEKQHRPLSNLIRLILMEWVEKQGKKYYQAYGRYNQISGCFHHTILCFKVINI